MIALSSKKVYQKQECASNSKGVFFEHCTRTMQCFTVTIKINVFSSIAASDNILDISGIDYAKKQSCISSSSQNKPKLIIVR